MKFIYIEDIKQNNQKIYYSKNEFLCKEWNLSDFSIMTGCAYIGLDINLYDKRISQISGVCPKELWIEKHLTVPNQIKNGNVYAECEEEWDVRMGTYLTNENTPIYYDKKSNIICIGDYNNKEGTINIRIFNNVIVSLKNNNLIAIWIEEI